MEPVLNPSVNAQAKVFINRRRRGMALGCFVVGVLLLLFVWSHNPLPNQPEGLRVVASLICIVHSIFGIYLSLKGDFDKKS